jgi:hypothetical protein
MMASAQRRRLTSFFLALELAGCAHGGGGSRLGYLPATNTALAVRGAHPSAAQLGRWPRSGPSVAVCPPVGPGFARCFAWIRTDVRGIGPDGVPPGYAPADLQTAYGLTGYSADNGFGQTVAIVDFSDNPNAEADLGMYRAYWGLPRCTTANGCFKKKRFTNKTSVSWAAEESLDVDMVSAICPNCHILLVEAKGSGQDALAAGVRYAAAHASYVSNSWGSVEGYKGDDGDFGKRGVFFAAATGDKGYYAPTKAQWPATLPTVIAVGGTKLSSIHPRIETAWSGAASACSNVYKKPSFQRDLNTGCSMRAQADISAEADPNTGVAIYDSFGSYRGYNGWHVIGGTSASTPIVTAAYALGGCSGSCANAAIKNSYLYAHASHLNDITSGSNGHCGRPLCTAGHGWDGPTGLGSPHGLGALTSPLVRISPATLKFGLVPGSSAKGVDVSQEGYDGKFTQSNSCAKVATIAQTSNAHGKARYSVTAIGYGSCSATFAGGNAQRAELAIEAPLPVQTKIGSGFSYPAAVSVAGNCQPPCIVYVVDTTGNAVDEITANGTGTLATGFDQPFGVAYDPFNGRVLVADTRNSQIKEIVSGIVSVFSSGFFDPFGVAVDSASNVYVADTDNNVIKKISFGTETATTIGPEFNGPQGVAVDGSGNVYVADTGDNVVKKIAPNGVVTTIGPTFKSPEGVAVNAYCTANCNVYVADTLDNAVKVIAPNGATGKIGSGFEGPTGVAVDAAGNLYVADPGHSAVWFIRP